MCLGFFCCYAIRVTTSVTLEAMTNAASANLDFEVRINNADSLPYPRDLKGTRVFPLHRRSSIGTNRWSTWSSAPSSGAIRARKYPPASSLSDGPLRDCFRSLWLSPECWLSSPPGSLVTAAGRPWSPEGQCAASSKVLSYRVCIPCCPDGHHLRSVVVFVSVDI